MFIIILANFPLSHWKKPMTNSLIRNKKSHRESEKSTVGESRNEKKIDYLLLINQTSDFSDIGSWIAKPHIFHFLISYVLVNTF